MSLIPLRDFQQRVVAECISEWSAGKQNVMPVAPTGAGKTVIIANIVAWALDNFKGNVICVAHRQELVSQISMTLARNGILHRVLNKTLVQSISDDHVRELGKPYAHPHAKVAVVGIDILAKMEPEDPFLLGCKLMVIDEGHHVLADNKWGKGRAVLPADCFGLFPTATPKRADRKGLGRWADGLVDAMVLAPTMRQIINMGFLTDYRIYCPTVSRLHLEGVKVSAATGDYNPGELENAVEKAQIHGDTVSAYQQFAAGKRAVCFNVNVEEAVKTADAFKAAGIPAAVLHGKTPKAERVRITRDLKSGAILVVCNCDVLGEGYDMPAIECTIFARPTMSYGLYVQQFGRALRILLPEWIGHADYNKLTDAERLEVLAASTKPHGIIIDQVGNVERHNLPDRPVIWSLDRGSKRETGSGDAIPIQHCKKCYQPFEKHLEECPYCGTAVHRAPAARTTPEQVEGNFMELDPEILRAMRGEAEKAVSESVYVPHGAPAAAVRFRHEQKRQAQILLRNIIDFWAGWRKATGESDAEAYRLFWYRYGIDVLSAAALGRPEALELARRVVAEMSAAGISHNFEVPCNEQK